MEIYGDEGGELEVERIIPPQVFSHGGARPQTKAFAAETAALTGQSKQEINRQLMTAMQPGQNFGQCG